MRLNDIEGLNLPKRKDEEFVKVNFDDLFSYDFKTHHLWKIQLYSTCT